jgi:hypothetical protein
MINFVSREESKQESREEIQYCITGSFSVSEDGSIGSKDMPETPGFKRRKVTDYDYKL